MKSFIRTHSFAIKLALIVVTIISLLSIGCTKSTDAPSKPKEVSKKWYRIAAIGNETVYSPVMNARGESGAIVFSENSQLRGEILSYRSLGNGMGEYKLRMTNRNSCQMILRWNWERINPTSIEPDDITKGTPQADVLKPNEVKYYTMIAKATPGALLVKSEKSQSNSSCSNSPTLRLNITLEVLPVKFINCSTSRDKITWDLTFNFTIEMPEDANTFEIQESENGKDYNSIHSFASDKKTKVYSIRVPNTH